MPLVKLVWLDHKDLKLSHLGFNATWDDKYECWVSETEDIVHYGIMVGAAGRLSKIFVDVNGDELTHLIRTFDRLEQVEGFIWRTSQEKI